MGTFEGYSSTLYRTPSLRELLLAASPLVVQDATLYTFAAKFVACFVLPLIQRSRDPFTVRTCYCSWKAWTVYSMDSVCEVDCSSRQVFVNSLGGSTNKMQRTWSASALLAETSSGYSNNVYSINIRTRSPVQPGTVLLQ